MLFGWFGYLIYNIAVSAHFVTRPGHGDSVCEMTEVRRDARKPQPGAACERTRVVDIKGGLC